MSAQVWLVTGASVGLGLSIARAALAAGHKVIATSRRPEKSAREAAEFERSGNGAWMKLDVTSDELEDQIKTCVEKFGKIDVLVNNAGYGMFGPLEDTPLDSIRAQFETNFFGAVRTIQTTIPLMRKQGSGTIVNISSTEGISTAPGLSVYAASKHALEAISESLQGELASFGIRVLNVNPGAMRTRFFNPASAVEIPMSEPYKGGPVEMVHGYLQSITGKENINPDLAARRIVEAVSGGGEGWPEGREKYLRLPLGKESGQRFAAKIESLKENVEAMQKITGSVDFE